MVGSSFEGSPRPPRRTLRFGKALRLRELLRRAGGTATGELTRTSSYDYEDRGDSSYLEFLLLR